jgi:hypothetical protein
VEVGSQLEPRRKTDQLAGARLIKVILHVQAHVGGVQFGGVGLPWLWRRGPTWAVPTAFDLAMVVRPEPFFLNLSQREMGAK